MNSTQLSLEHIEILLVEDDEGDVLLTKKALANGKIVNSLSVARDGVEAMEFLRREGSYFEAPRPDLIMLDLNMPRMDGREVLAQIKQDESLKTIPVVILTTSDSDQDILESYGLQANCFITKPVDLQQFVEVIQAVGNFWFSVVKLPPQ